MNRRRTILAIAAAIVLCPICARADVGTPLVWGSAFHLLLGNTLIGLFEGWLLARVFDLPQRRCVWLLIPANYLSAWIGATNSNWRLGWAHWPDVGMWARDGSKTVRIAYGTRFGGYTPYRVIHLPGDKALLQLDDQICLVDIPARKIARIRKGYGMLAFQETQIVKPDGAANGSQPFSSDINPTSSSAGSRR